ncbi:MAG: arsenite methyltransferase [Alphaproteobacteria bacterium]
MTEPNQAHDQVHDEVAGFYAKALVRNSCCGSNCGTSTAESIGYQASDTSEIPDDAMANSFGCGNPVAFSGVHEGDVVVDLGSGAGIDVIMAGQKVGATGHVIGVDMTGDMIDRARANIAAAGLANAEIRQGLIEHMPVDDDSVDWVISNCVINLSPDKPAVFAEIARVLKPGGQMLVSDIVVEDLPQWVRADKALYSACVAGAVSESAYLAGLRAACLVDVEIRDRLDYDTSQITAMYRGEWGGEEATDESVARAAMEATGKVSSISVYARRPEG